LKGLVGDGSNGKNEAGSKRFRERNIRKLFIGGLGCGKAFRGFDELA